MNILIWQLKRDSISSKFDINEVKKDWIVEKPNISNSETLSQELNKLIKLQYTKLLYLIACCNQGNKLHYTAFYPDGETESFEYQTDDYRDTQEILCQKFSKLIHGYFEVYSRDYDVLRGYRDGIRIKEPFVVMVLNGDKYEGHIYAWFSSDNNNRIYAMGIRGEVDRSLRRDAPSNISSYILEGVRLLGLVEGKTEMVITHPIGVMTSILSKLGFTPEIVDGRELKESVADGISRISYNCWVKKITINPIIEVKNLQIYK